MTPSIEDSSSSKRPYFSVIILFWNSNLFIQNCLDSLNKQTFHDFEVILVNNASPEPFPQDIFSQFPTITIKYIHQDSNLGFAEGNNIAADHAEGRFLVLLNSDAFPKKDWLESVNRATEQYPGCFFASKLIMANSPDRLDGEGDVYHISGMVWRKSHSRLSSHSRSHEGEVFSACGAAAVYPKEGFELVGGFDPDYFAYVEDVDLGFRLRLVGYKCIYLPSAEVFHIGTGSTGKRSELSTYYGQRNLIWTFFKDMPLLMLIFLLPLHVIVNIIMIFLSIFHNQGLIFLKSKVDAFKSMDIILQKRRIVQRTRKISILKLLSVMDCNPLSPLILYLRR